MYRGAITELDETALQEVFHTNVIAAMMLTGLCTASLAQQEGAVVFVGSIHTRRAFPRRLTLRRDQSGSAGPDARARR